MAEVRDVTLEEVLEEQKGNAPSSSDNVFMSRGQPQTEEEKREADAKRKAAEEDLELLAPKVAPRQWTFGPEGSQRTYIQYELSVTGSAQWFGLVGEVLEDALSGDHALSLNSLLSMPTPRGGQLQIQDFQDADMFVHALGKLLTHAPKFLEKSVCIWLAVPDYEWELVAELMKLPPSQGGMSHEQFEEILATFIDQNYPEIDRFFRVRFPRLRDRWQARAKEASQSRFSKP
jgi:hypothetical protein